MTVEDIISIAKQERDKEMTFVLFSQLFKKDIKFLISFDDDNEVISKTTLDTINEFLSLNQEETKIIDEEIWKHCLGCNGDTRSSYDGGVTWVESKLADNLAEYDIKTKEDALKQSQIKYIYIANKWRFEGRIFWLCVSTTWDNEHEIVFCYINGKLDSVS